MRILDEKMAVRDRNVNVAFLDGCVPIWAADRQSATSREKFSQLGVGAWRGVLNDQDARGQIGRHAFEKCLQGIHASC